jgi:hypothetical protein
MLLLTVPTVEAKKNYVITDDLVLDLFSDKIPDLEKLLSFSSHYFNNIEIGSVGLGNSDDSTFSLSYNLFANYEIYNTIEEKLVKGGIIKKENIVEILEGNDDKEEDINKKGNYKLICIRYSHSNTNLHLKIYGPILIPN